VSGIFNPGSDLGDVDVVLLAEQRGRDLVIDHLLDYSVSLFLRNVLRFVSEIKRNENS
jgi:hypothetical protein